MARVGNRVVRLDFYGKAICELVFGGAEYEGTRTTRHVIDKNAEHAA